MHSKYAMLLDGGFVTRKLQAKCGYLPAAGIPN